MKRSGILAIILVACFGYGTSSVLGQQGTETLSKPTKAGSGVDVSRMGTPIHSETKDGMKVQVWLVTQEQHEKLMPAAKDESAVRDYRPEEDGNGLSKDALEKSDMPGRKYDAKSKNGVNSETVTTSKPNVAIVVITDAAGKARVENAGVELIVTSPGNKAVKVALEPMDNHYAHDVQLLEKVTYRFTLRVTRDGKTSTMNFSTSVPMS